MARTKQTARRVIPEQVQQIYKRLAEDALLDSLNKEIDSTVEQPTLRRLKRSRDEAEEVIGPISDEGESEPSDAESVSSIESSIDGEDTGDAILYDYWSFSEGARNRLLSKLIWHYHPKQLDPVQKRELIEQVQKIIQTERGGGLKYKIKESELAGYIQRVLDRPEPARKKIGELYILSDGSFHLKAYECDIHHCPISLCKGWCF